MVILAYGTRMHFGFTTWSTYRNVQRHVNMNFDLKRARLLKPFDNKPLMDPASIVCSLLLNVYGLKPITKYS